MGWLRNWRRERYLARHPLVFADWVPLFQDEILAWLAPEARERLARMAHVFLFEKSVAGVQDFEPTLEQARRVALYACLPVLELGLDWLDGWVSVLLYPDRFVVDREEQDEIGLVHHLRDIRSGEAWLHGPVILSHADVAAAEPGYNVVIHEIAHKLDMHRGDLNGLPPLPESIPVAEWEAAFSPAFDQLNAILDAGAEPLLDPYAAEAPEEFFAVVCEYFFTAPGFLEGYYPELYRLLSRLFHQQP